MTVNDPNGCTDAFVPMFPVFFEFSQEQHSYECGMMCLSSGAAVVKCCTPTVLWPHQDLSKYFVWQIIA